MRMPELDGSQVLNAVVRDGIPTRVLFLSTHTESGMVYDLLARGAAGYLDKVSSSEEVCNAIVAASRGETVLTGSIEGDVLQQIRIRGADGGHQAHGSRAGGAATCRRRSLRSRHRLPAIHRDLDRQEPSSEHLREAGCLGAGGCGRRGNAPRASGIGAPLRRRLWRPVPQVHTQLLAGQVPADHAIALIEVDDRRRLRRPRDRVSARAGELPGLGRPATSAAALSFRRKADTVALNALAAPI